MMMAARLVSWASDVSREADVNEACGGRVSCLEWNRITGAHQSLNILHSTLHSLTLSAPRSRHLHTHIAMIVDTTYMIATRHTYMHTL